MSYYEENDDAKRSFNINVWLKLKRFFTPYKWFIFGNVVANLLVAFIDILLPLFQSYAVNNFIVAGTSSGLGKFAFAYGVAIVIQFLGVITFARIAIIIEMRMGYDLRESVFRHLQTLSLSYYNTTPVGYIMARVLSDTNRIGSMIAWGLVDILWAVTYVVGVLIAMLMLNVKLALLIMAVIPLMAIITVYFQRRLLDTHRKMRKINSKMTGEFNEGITGARTTKTLVIEDKNLEGFRQTSGLMRDTSMRMARLNAIFVPIIVFFGSAATAIVLARGGYLAMNDMLLLGTLSAFLSYAIGIFEPIQQLAGIFADVISLQVNIERVTDLLEKEPLIKDTPDVIEKYGDTFEPKTENWEPIEGEIEFKDVTFQYPDGNEEVLSHFNLKIPAGTNIAIVGETGAGKSTLVNLACRFYEPTAGQILIDGRDYRERSQLWLHSNIGYVLQNPHLFSGTIRENIRYGRLDATDEEVEEAARIVSADTIVRKLDKGYDSEVGEGGDRLSTGEKQLISFARAILADPKIFVLDEATSSIDTQTEKLIQDGIEYLLKGRTSFIIAHRLSTIRQADVILVVRDGKIVEQGTHHELMVKKGYYYMLYTKQFEDEKTKEVLK